MSKIELINNPQGDFTKTRTKQLTSTTKSVSPETKNKKLKTKLREITKNPKSLE